MDLFEVGQLQVEFFESIEVAALPILRDFDARQLSNLIYSFGLVKYNPTFENEEKE